MTNDSHLFKTLDYFTRIGAARDRTAWLDSKGKRWVPLYEAKMIHHYDHRWATYEPDGTTVRDMTDEEKLDPHKEPLPRYWVPEEEVEKRLLDRGWDRQWLMGWRGVTNATNERTVIATVFPRVGVGNSAPLLVAQRAEPALLAALLANLSSLVLDFHARHKIGGSNLSLFILEQLAVLPPSAYDSESLGFIVPRVLELLYTSLSLSPFARDLGYDGRPFQWDTSRRAILRAELDAYFAFLYGLTRDELRYILDPADIYGAAYPSETFRVLKNNEYRRYGEYRTRRLVLEAWDRLRAEGLIDDVGVINALP
jgi:hypothetical protein